MSDRIGTRLRPPDPRWTDPPVAEPAHVEELMRRLRLPRAVCAVLVNRGYASEEAAKNFLRPRLGHVSPASRLADGPRAARRLAAAVRSGEQILVHGDYDVDGVCATALLTRWLRAQGARVEPFVPHRIRDGYDFGPAGVQRAVEVGAGLVVTVDCGTSAGDAVSAAREAGVDVVVTDHHTVGSAVPPALAFVNPQRADCTYPDKGLCGTGVAYRLAELVSAELGAGADDLVEMLDLVALATIADLVPLRGDNRVFAHFGLRRMARTRLPGVRELLRVSGIEGDVVRAGQVGFQLAPRINAAGRVGDAADALRLLLTDDAEEAAGLAERLDGLNRTRRDEDRKTLDEALALLEESYDPERDFGVVVAGEGWHPGVIGIVASRLVERIHRPVVVVGLDGARGRGSARSIPGFHLYEAIAACGAHLGRFGGHEQAAGMDLERSALEPFRAAFNDVARGHLVDADLRPTLKPDLDVDLSEVGLDLVHWLGYLGPHGIGNPGPLFRSRRLRLDGARVAGDAHLKGTLTDGTAHLDAIGFGLAARVGAGSLGDASVDALFRLDRNEWRGRARAQAKLADVRISDGAGSEG